MKILVVIDMQEKYMNMYDSDLVTRVNAEIKEAQDKGYTIIYVKNSGNPDEAADYAFAHDLEIVSDNIFEKHHQSAFSSAEFTDFIVKSTIEEVDIIGADGRICVARTAINFAAQGYKTKVLLNCVGAKDDKYYKDAIEKMKAAGVETIIGRDI